MEFIQETIALNMDVWDTYIHQPFLKDIRKHRMEEKTFIHYLIEDSKYLKDYARCLGMGIYKSKTIKEIHLFFDMLKFVDTNETVVRVSMLKKLGYDISFIEQEKQHKVTKAYTDFLLDISKQGEGIDILFALLPCMLSYAYIGTCLIKENPDIIEESLYGEWIGEYCHEMYLEKCKRWTDIANHLCLSLSEEKKKSLQALFRNASKHELAFWNMSYDKKEEEK